MKLIFREFNKYFKLIIYYLSIAILILGIYPGFLDSVDGINFQQMIKGNFTKLLELLWWIFFLILPLTFTGKYWHMESSSIFFFEFIRFKSFKDWLKTKISFIIILHLVIFSITGLTVVSLFKFNVSFIYWIIYSGLLIIFLNLVFIFLTAWISSFSIIFSLIIFTFILFLRFSIIQFVLNPLLLLTLIFIFFTLIFKIIKPSSFIIKRRERD